MNECKNRTPIFEENMDNIHEKNNHFTLIVKKKKICFANLDTF